MDNNIILNLKKSFNSLIGFYDGIKEPLDVIPFVVKLCVDEALKLNSDDITVEHKDFGSLEIKKDEITYKIDIKTQNINKTYSFPNLISIKKAKDILTNYDNFIFYVFIEYEIIDEKVRIDRIRTQNIESLDWEYLYIQNLGKGQLQIKNISKDEFLFNSEITRTQWLSLLREKGIEYYNNLMLKVAEYKSEWEDE